MHNSGTRIFRVKRQIMGTPTKKLSMYKNEKKMKIEVKKNYHIKQNAVVAYISHRRNVVHKRRKKHDQS